MPADNDSTVAKPGSRLRELGLVLPKPPSPLGTYVEASQVGSLLFLSDTLFDRTATSFDNPDHVSIVIHNYRWRLGLADGESKCDDLEKSQSASGSATGLCPSRG